MWSRLILIALGLWMQASPLVFQHPPVAPLWQAFDVASGMCIVLLSAVALFRRAPAVASFTVLTGAILIGAAYADFGDPPPTAQNRAFVGLLVMLLGSIRVHRSLARTGRSSHSLDQSLVRRLPTSSHRAVGDTFAACCNGTKPGRRHKTSRLRGNGDWPNSRL